MGTGKCLVLSSYSSTEHYFAKRCDDMLIPVFLSLEGYVLKWTPIVLDVYQESFYKWVHINYCNT